MTEDVVTRQKTRIGTPAELAASREARGMSRIDISQRIKLQVRQVVALEEGQWDALPGRAFVRGALRSYGRLLDVDVGPLLESIGGFAEPTQVSVMQPLDASSSRSRGRGFDGGGRGSPMLWVVAGLIGVAAVVVYFGSGEDAARIRSWLPDVGRPADGAADTAPAASPAPVAGSPSASTGSGPAASTAPSDAAGQGMPSSSALARSGSGTSGSGLAGAGSAGTAGTAAIPAVPGSSPPAAAATPAAPVGVPPAAPSAAPSAALPAGPSAAPSAAPAGTAATGEASIAARAAADVDGVMHFKANKDAWVEARNADGSMLHNRMVKAGSSIELKGTAPYRLVVGNASSVELSYQGKTQDLKPHIQANNIARLQLR